MLGSATKDRASSACGLSDWLMANEWRSTQLTVLIICDSTFLSFHSDGLNRNQSREDPFGTTDRRTLLFCS